MTIVLPSNTQDPMSLDLQLFADGDGVTGAQGAQGEAEGAAPPQSTTGDKASQAGDSSAAGESTKQETGKASMSPQERSAAFEALIKGEYKDLYDARVQTTVQRRLKGQKETVDRYNELAPVIETIAGKYGVDPTDAAALAKAVSEDETYFEDEALELGISVQQLKHKRALERENATLKRQMQEAERRDNAQRLYSKWIGEAEAAKKVYPGFDLDTELQNEDFLSLIQNGFSVQSAYQSVHFDDIVASAMQYAVQEAEKKVTQKVMAGSARPVENGNSSQGATVVKRDVTQLTNAEIDDLNRRAARGERIEF